MKATPVEKFGKDHFSLLAYCESVCVERQALDRERMRCNPITHPMLLGYRTGPDRSVTAGKYTYPTRLKGFFEDASQCIDGHDDWDCLDDLEAAGLVEIFSLVNALVRMTTKGLAVAHKLREFKTKGGNFASFVMAA